MRLELLPRGCPLCGSAAETRIVAVQGGPPGASLSSTKSDSYRRASASPDHVSCLLTTLRTGEAGSIASTPTYESHHSHPPERLPRIFAPAKLDLERLDRFAFSARKLPEYMHYRLLECAGCDLLYASPAPAESALVKQYQEAAFAAGRESRAAARTYASFLPAIAARLPERRGALDIGTGDGAFLAELWRHGFVEVMGVEPSAAPIASADAAIRPHIRHAPFRAQDFARASFALVTCFQTLEHVYDPLGLARAAHGLLRQGGAVLFVVHNRRALLARLLGLRSPIFDIEHLQLFSPRSARGLLERAGFTDVETKIVVNRYALAYWSQLFPLPKLVKRGVAAALVASRLGALPIPAPVGNLAVIGYKRGA